MSNRLILLAHGSRRAAWRAPMEALCERLGPTVEIAYLEACAPSLADVIRGLATEQVTSVRVLPLFWSGGGHVAHDVPPQVAAISAELPDIDIEVLPAVGEHPVILAALEAIARASSQ